MKNDLPKVFANNITKQFTNNEELFTSINEQIRSVSKSDLLRKLNEIFNSPNHVYKSKVLINILGKEQEKIIVGRNELNVFTLDGEKIPLSDIYDIKKRS